jgi:hypothetical protein
VATTQDMAGGNVTATVTIGGVCTTCTNLTASETGSIVALPTSSEFDTFANVPNDEVKARVDNFYIELNNNPSAAGYIINYGTDKEITRREKQIRDAIKFRNYDASRITFVRGGDSGTGIRTVFFIVPAGATPPTPQP